MPRPYGPLGLIVSLVVIGLLALTYFLCAGAVAALIDALAQGPAHVLAIWRASFALARSGGLQSSTSLTFVVGLLIYLATLAAVLTLAVWRGGRDWRGLIAWKTWSPLRAGKAYWALVACGFIYGVAASVAFGVFFPQATHSIQFPPGRTGVALSFLVAVLVGPLTEEIVFRGWIFTSLRARLSFWPANVVGASAFAIAHWERTHLYAAAIFPLGLMLGLAREKTESTQASAVFHGLYNAGLLTLYLFAPS